MDNYIIGTLNRNDADADDDDVQPKSFLEQTDTIPSFIIQV